MKAFVYDKHGSPDLLVLREVEKPAPDHNEVLVRIHAVSANAADYRSMRMGIIPKRKIFGADISGRVESVGKSVRQFKPGDEVIGDLSLGFGGFAEYAVAPESALAHKPANVSFEEAAAIPMAALTALQALRDKGGIRQGQKVLIVGAGGGVGTFAVQLAKYYEADVTAVCGAQNVEIVRFLGVDRIIDYTKDDFTKSKNRYDLILAVNGSHTLSAYRRALNPKGVLVVVGGALAQVIKALAFGGVLSISGKQTSVLAAKSNLEDLQLLISLVETGRIRPVIDRCYPFGETAEAMRYAGGGHALGKVVINVLQEGI